MSASTLRRFAVRPVIAFSIIVACCTNQAGEKAQSSSQGDSVTSNSSLTRDSTFSTERDVVAPAEYVDSAKAFDPDGYYTPKEDVKVDGRKIGWLELHTVDFYYGGESHYERPKLVQPPEVTLSVSLPNSANDSTYPCAASSITPDSLSLRCGATPVGDVKIDGHFLDKRGRYSDRLAYENKPTVLLIARVLVTKADKVVHDAVHHFTFSSGD
jgi:hypothetical protein